MIMPKKSIFALILFLLIILTILYLITRGTKEEEVIKPVQYFSPTPSATYIPTPAPIPAGLEEEKIMQENYAKSREEFFQSKPWASKLPIKSGNYFVSFDPENDILLATLYYSSEADRAIQVAGARKDALAGMQKIGIDTEKQKIQFTEVLFK